MPTYYSVVRYMPDPITEESINFGVVVFSGDTTVLRLTDDWYRAKQFGRRQPTALREAVDQLQKLDNQNALTESVIRRYVDVWQREVTLTAPRASLLEVEALADKLAVELLRFPEEAPHSAGKRKVVGMAKTSVAGELVRRYKVSKARARRAIHSSAELEGVVKEHVLDLAIYNGVFLGGGVGVSLLHPSKPQIEREIDAVAFALGDLRAKGEYRRKPLYVLGHTRGVEPKAVTRAADVFAQVGGEFVAEDRIPGWSREFVHRLPDRVFGE